MANHKPKALVFLATGFEEVEAVTPVDYLRRAGVEVCTAAVDAEASGETMVSGSHGIAVKADTGLSGLVARGELLPGLWDAVILPGGLPGASNLAGSAEIAGFLAAMAKADKWICAICAAPAVVLGPLGLLAGRRFTCFPGMEETVKGAAWTADRVVIDKNPRAGGVITSRGAGTAGVFACAIISQLAGEPAARELADKVLLG